MTHPPLSPTGADRVAGVTRRRHTPNFPPRSRPNRGPGGFSRGDMTDLQLIPEPAPDTQPICWRCTWVRNVDHSLPTLERPKPERRDFKTREEAETFKAAVSRERYVMTMTPVFARRRSMTKKALAQALDAAGWPLQHRPMR